MIFRSGTMAGILPWIISLLLLVHIVGFAHGVTARGHPHAKPRRSSHHHKQVVEGGSLLGEEVVGHMVNEHLADQLGEVYSEVAVENMTEEERDFHYFTVHDYDNNNFLDGLEVLKAVNHVIEEEEEEKVGEEGENVREKQFALLVEMIDKVLEQDDTDKDGRLSYSEFMAGRRRGEALGDLSDPRR